MLQRLSATGIVGALLFLGGLGLVTYANPVIGLGLALAFAGLGLVVRSVVQGLLSSLGMV